MTLGIQRLAHFSLVPEGRLSAGLAIVGDPRPDYTLPFLGTALQLAMSVSAWIDRLVLAC